MMKRICDECAIVADSDGIDLPYSDPYEYVCDVATKTGANTSSMLSDVNVRHKIDSMISLMHSFNQIH